MFFFVFAIVVFWVLFSLLSGLYILVVAGHTQDRAIHVTTEALLLPVKAVKKVVSYFRS